MANTPISGFASGAPAQAGDEFVIARSGANFKLTNTNISSFVLAGPTTQLGAADVASGAVAQTLQVQSNTGAATTGPNFTIKGSSGTTAGGSIIFQTHNGTSYSTALRIDADKIVYPGGSLYLGFGSDAAQLYVRANNNGQVPLSIQNSSTVVLSSAVSLCWGTSSNATSSYDTILARDAVGGSAPAALALKNSTNPQIFRAYSTTTGPSYGYFASGVTDAGVATADTLFIGTGGAGAAMTKLALVVNGTSALSFSGTAATFAGDITATTRTLTIGNVGLASTGYLAWSGRGGFYAYGDGQFRIRNNADTGDTTLVWGSATSSFPALKRSSATLQVRLADDSGDAAFQCGTATSGGTAFNVNGTGGNSIASVTNTTTGTLLQVLNSTSNPLMTVTDTTSGTLFSVQSTTAATLFSVNDTTSGTLLAVTNSSATDVFTVSDAGVLTVASNINAAAGIGDWSVMAPSNGALLLSTAAGTSYSGVYLTPSRMSITSSMTFGWSSTTNSNGANDVILARDNPAELALRNGNNGQIFRVYGRYTDGSNYERFFINAPTTSAAAVQIGTQKAGTGSARALELQTDGTTALTLTTAQKAEFAASIKTAAPTTGTAAEWKLGSRVAATTTLDTTQYIELDVGGTLYKLAVVTV